MGLTDKFNSKMTAEDFCLVDIQQLIQSLKIKKQDNKITISQEENLQ